MTLPMLAKTPRFGAMKAQVRSCVGELHQEVKSACGKSVGEKTDTALDLVDGLSSRLSPDNVVEGKRFLRHCIWATRKGLTEESPELVTTPVKKALEDTRNTCLDISWTKEMRKIPSERWVNGPRPRPQDIPNFERVNEHFLRGGQPDSEGVNWLREHGVKTVLDLRGGDRDNQWSEVDTTGVQLETIDIPDFQPPTFEQVEKAIEVLNDPEMQPVFLHCKAGVGRTGTITACWRIAGGATAEEALAKEKINSYHGSLRQEQFVRDYEEYLKQKSEGKNQPPAQPDLHTEQDHWPLIMAYSDVSKGVSPEQSARTRELSETAEKTLYEFADYWSKKS